MKYANFLDNDQLDVTGGKSDSLEKNKKKKKDCVAKKLIIQCMHDSQINILRDKSTAYEMWTGLVDTFQKKG